MTSRNDSHPDKNLAAVCGLFCPTCTLFIGTAENEPQRLKAVADVYHTAADVWECLGYQSPHEVLWKAQNGALAT